MQLFGFTITRTKAAGPLQSVTADRGWWPVIRESVAGAWQTNVEVRAETVLAYSAVYACHTLIASDIAKMGLKLVEQDNDGIWSLVARDSPFWPVLRKPNHYQTRIKFFESWINSKLIAGNTYVLKQRDNRGVVTAAYPLDPFRVRPLIAPDGSVFYEVKTDILSGVPDQVIVPAREIIHDIMVALYHPLVGVSPITACGLAAMQGLAIQGKSEKFFGAGSQPGGVLTAPGTIAQETANRLKLYWDENFTGDNIGKVAVLGDGLKYEPMALTSVEAQLIEQLKWSAETVCSAYHVPPWMVGVGPLPTYNNIEALTQQYYSQCLQTHIESIELLLDEGLELPRSPRVYGTEFELDDLLRMDSATKMATAKDGVGGGIYSPNEARAKFDLKPKPGGDSPMVQQQYYSLAALDRRDSKAPAPATPEPGPAVAPAPAPDQASTRAVVELVEKTADMVKAMTDRLPAPHALPPASTPAAEPGRALDRFRGLLLQRILASVATNTAKVRAPEPEKKLKRVERDAKGLILRIVEE